MEIFLITLHCPVATDTPPLKQSTRRRNPASFPTMLLDNRSNKGFFSSLKSSSLQEGSRNYESASSWCTKKLKMFIALRHCRMMVQKVSPSSREKAVLFCRNNKQSNGTEKRIMPGLPWLRNGPKKKSVVCKQKTSS